MAILLAVMLWVLAVPFGLWWAQWLAVLVSAWMVIPCACLAWGRFSGQRERANTVAAWLFLGPLWLSMYALPVAFALLIAWLAAQIR